MITSVWSLKSHLAWSQGDPAHAVGLAEAGRRDEDGVSPGVRALIAQQQAREHALDANGEGADRLLDVADELTARAAEQPDGAPPWVYFHGPLAAALDGQVDRAATVGREALALAVETGSAHTVADLRRMRRALGRWADDPVVAEFDEAVAAASAR